MKKAAGFLRRLAVLGGDCLEEVLADRGAGNATDVFTGNAEVGELAVAHAAEFVDGLTILAPGVVSACDVHGGFLSELGCIAVRPEI